MSNYFGFDEADVGDLQEPPPVIGVPVDDIYLGGPAGIAYGVPLAPFDSNDVPLTPFDWHSPSFEQPFDYAIPYTRPFGGGWDMGSPIWLGASFDGGGATGASYQGGAPVYALSDLPTGPTLHVSEPTSPVLSSAAPAGPSSNEDGGVYIYGTFRGVQMQVAYGVNSGVSTQFSFTPSLVGIGGGVSTDVQSPAPSVQVGEGFEVAIGRDGTVSAGYGFNVGPPVSVNIPISMVTGEQPSANNLPDWAADATVSATSYIWNLPADVSGQAADWLFTGQSTDVMSQFGNAASNAFDAALDAAFISMGGGLPGAAVGAVDPALFAPAPIAPMQDPFEQQWRDIGQHWIDIGRSYF